MRTTWLVILTLCASAVFGPSQALEASDTMAAWSAASANEKTDLVTKILKRDRRESGTTSIVKCLDAASKAPGHADLQISKVVEACEKQDAEPV